MDSSGHISNKKKSRKTKPRKTRRFFSSPAPAALELVGPDGAGDLIALIQRGRIRSAPVEDLGAEKHWGRLEEMRECSRSGLIEFTQDEKYFLFRIANKDNCDMEIIARRIVELYEFRKVFAIYWKSAKSNRKF